MKKYLILAIFALFISGPALAANDCPFGLVNDPAPGDCSLYVDTDGNYLCDRSEGEAKAETSISDNGTKALSEDELKTMSVAEVANYFGVSAAAYQQELGAYLGKEVEASESLGTLHDRDGLCAGVAASVATGLKEGKAGVGEAVASQEAHDLISGQELKTKTVSEVAQIYGISASIYAEELSQLLGQKVAVNDSFQTLHDQADLSPSTAKDLANTIVAGTSASQGKELKEVSDTKTPEASAKSKTGKRTYKFFVILFSLLILYLISSFLVKAKSITLLTHRRIWNVLLLISFLVSAIFGIMLVLAINFGWFIPIYSFILYWHVEFGSAMAIITIFHIAWHWRYFTCMFQKRKEPSCVAKNEDEKQA
jgi:hypothetical protein